MFCSRCGTQVSDDSAFCQECGAATGANRSSQPGYSQPSAGGDRQLRLHPAMVAGVVVAVLGVVLLILFLAGPLGDGGGDGGLGGGSDEDQVRNLFERSASLWNDRDWRGLYDLMSPTYRETCSFEEFLEPTAATFAFTGGREIEARDVSVTVNGDTAYASYDLYIGGDYFAHEDSYRFAKEDGRWYDPGDDLC